MTDTLRAYHFELNGTGGPFLGEDSVRLRWSIANSANELAGHTINMFHASYRDLACIDKALAVFNYHWSDAGIRASLVPRKSQET